MYLNTLGHYIVQHLIFLLNMYTPNDKIEMTGLTALFVPMIDMYLNHLDQNITDSNDSLVRLITSLNFNALEKLQRQFREILIIRLHITQIFHGMLEDRLLMLRFLSAKERYDNLIKKEHYLFNRAALGHIASYLGITQVTLSRIR